MTHGITLDTGRCYQALLTHDARFDGAFFVGVSTTKIYCRTVCTARTPRPERCTFYPSAAAAEKAGYRPCLRCRPEIAPGPSHVDAIDRLAGEAAARIEAGALTEDGGVADLAEELGISTRHLRRVLTREFGVSPVQLAQTQRLLLAKRLLTDTDLGVGEIAFASGFASLRRFNALFAANYRMTPTDLRKPRPAGKSGAARDTLTLEAAHHPPLDWDSLLSFLVGQAAAGVEARDGDCYLRTLRMGKHTGWLAVTPLLDRPALQVTLSASLAPALRPVLARVRRVFDLGADPDIIAAHLGTLAAAHPGLRIPGAFDGFETAVRAILGQQVSVRAASTLAARVAARFGDPVETPFPVLTHLAPTAARLAAASAEELTALGILPARARSVVALAHAVNDGEITLEPGGDVPATLARLKELPGIGDWTAQYIALRVLAWPDAFPHTDLALMKAMGETSSKLILERAEFWRPWRGYAALHLWKSLEPAPKETLE